jgi:methionyl aminopeptidase
MILSAGRAGKGSKIFENMVFTIEPMFTLGSGKVKFDQSKEDGWTVTTADGSMAAHEEHTILVTKKGYEVLTEIEESEVLPV